MEVPIILDKKCLAEDVLIIIITLWWAFDASVLKRGTEVKVETDVLLVVLPN